MRLDQATAEAGVAGISDMSPNRVGIAFERVEAFEQGTMISTARRPGWRGAGGAGVVSVTSAGAR